MKASPLDNFLKPTNIFSIVGIFIPGFTAIIILLIQTLIKGAGIECAFSWTILWTFTGFGSIILPIYFFWYISNSLSAIKKIKTSLTFFNIAEYTLLQATIGMFFSDGKTLCYVTDGQNGIQFVFTACLLSLY
ncbi:hypothetical protein [Mucilaginibacter sp.]|uniref:hypothetical protein n=1 Tax=Mucilaginibacter sp. TaxID=1882438 RepID=UPI0035BBA343